MVDDKEMASAEGDRGVVSEAENQSLSMVKIVGWGGGNAALAREDRYLR